MLKHTALFAFTTLFVVVDPAPLFVTLTPGVPESERQVIAIRAASIVAGSVSEASRCCGRSVSLCRHAGFPAGSYFYCSRSTW